MPRPIRRLEPDLATHITQRAVNRQTCFPEDADRHLFAGLLEEHGPGLGCSVHAYVVMTNHVHILLSPRSSLAASLLMKRIGQSYAQHFNRKYQRNGALWEGRFRSCLVDDPSYLMRCYRYIEMNPVRAGLSRSAESYLWSSYRANAFGGRTWLSPHRTYLTLGATERERCDAYQAFFAQEIDEAELERFRIATRMGAAVSDKRVMDRLTPVRCEGPAGSPAEKGV